MAFTAVLLAGGESRRMGRDKATMDWCGRPLWESQLEKLRELRPEKILVSARSDPSWRPVDIGLALDSPPSKGPLSGLIAALDCTDSAHLLTLAVDMPFMTTLHLRGLCDRATDGMGVIPIIEGKAEPLAAIYPTKARAIFLEAWQGDDYSLQPIIARLIALNMLRAMPVSGPPSRLYKSVNEPDDL
jgi:molybdopterin-guanine dinucleotide biosynthesis protein A